MGRFFAGLVIVALFLPPAAHATSAISLSGRVVIDGVLDEYQPDEWILDPGSTPGETDHDSPWGRDNDIARVALTWDRTYLYLGVEGRAFDSFFSMFVSNRAGGLASLEDAGEFRRAITLPSPTNLMALAAPGSVPVVARADDAHPFALVDRGALPVAIAGTRAGTAGFEMAVPWSMLLLSEPVRVVAAITGAVGSGAGDSAPDATAAMEVNRFARAVLDRWIEIDADTDHDGLADVGVSPRTAVSIEPQTSPTEARDEAGLRLVVATPAFAPERGESARIDLTPEAGTPVFVTLSVYSLEGERTRVLAEDRPVAGATSLAWNGADDHGHIVRGAAYVVVADWGYNRGEHSGRAKAAVVVVR